MEKRLATIVKVLRRHHVTKDFSPANVRSVLEELGPTYVKMGQLLSTRPDLIPDEYANEFKKLKTSVQPMPFDTVQSIINQNLGSVNVFQTIDSTPLGSASIGQVHIATLTNGQKVVVKVMRPNIAQIIEDDMTLLLKTIKYLNLLPNAENFNLKNVVTEIWSALRKETDFTIEAYNLQHMAELTKDVKFVRIPKVYSEYSTANVLTMEYIDGIKIDDVDNLVTHGYDLNEISSKLVDNFITQALDEGFYHADPHTGNIMIAEGKIVWLDLGMVGVLSDSDKTVYKKMIVAIMDDNIFELKELILSIVEVKGEVDHIKLYHDIDHFVKKYRNIPVADINMATLLQEFITLLHSHRFILPENVSVLVRALILLQETVSYLDKSVSLMTFIKNHFVGLRLDMISDVITDAKNILVSSKRAITIPTQISELLEQTVKGEGQVGVRLSNVGDITNVSKRNYLLLTLSILISVCMLSAVAVFAVLYAVSSKLIYEILLVVFGVLALLTMGALVIMYLLTLYNGIKKK